MQRAAGSASQRRHSEAERRLAALATGDRMCEHMLQAVTGPMAPQSGGAAGGVVMLMHIRS